MERTYQAPKKRRRASLPLSVLFPVLVTGTVALVHLLLFAIFLMLVINTELKYIFIILPLLVPAAMAGVTAWGMARGKAWSGNLLIVYDLFFLAVYLISRISWEFNIFYIISEQFIYFYLITLLLLVPVTIAHLVVKRREDYRRKLQRAMKPSSRMPEMAPSHSSGEILRGRYEVIEPLGRGASGAVYLVKDLTFGASDVRWVLKEIELSALSLEEREEAAALFDKECALLKNMNHPAIPKLIEHYIEQDSAVLVMEYVQGRSLEAMLKEQGGPLEVEKVLEIAEELASILAHLHRTSPHPLIFRDLKPSNIMMTSKGRLRLIDFGIARYYSPGKQKDTMVYGTPGFSPPEQYGLAQTDERSDIYAFGATLYHLLTAEEPEQFCFSFPQLRSLNGSVPAKLESLVMRCLRRERSERPSSAEQLCVEIEMIKSGLGAFQCADGKDPWIGFYFLAAAAVKYLSINASGNMIDAAVYPALAAIAIAGCAGMALYRVYRKRRSASSGPDFLMKIGQFFSMKLSLFENRLQSIFAKGR